MTCPTSASKPNAASVGVLGSRYGFWIMFSIDSLIVNILIIDFWILPLFIFIFLGGSTLFAPSPNKPQWNQILKAMAIAYSTLTCWCRSVTVGRRLSFHCHLSFRGSKKWWYQGEFNPPPPNFPFSPYKKASKKKNGTHTHTHTCPENTNKKNTFPSRWPGPDFSPPRPA